MTRRFINELSDGDSIDDVFLIADKQIRANRNASLYLLVEMRDKTGVLSARMWNVTEQSVTSARGISPVLGEKCNLTRGLYR